MTGAPLHVGLLSPVFWPEVLRGGERIVHELGTGLIARGHEATLITSHRGRPGRAVEHGLPVVRVRRPPGDRLLEWRGFEAHLAHVPPAALALRREAPGLAHAVHVSGGLATAAWTRRTGRPSVFTHLGIPDHVDVMGRRRRLELLQRVIAGSSAVTVLSRTSAEALWRWLGVEAHVTYPGVDLSVFAPGPRAAAPTVFCAGDAGEPRKRVADLVAALPLVRRRRPGTRLERAEGVELVGPLDRRGLATAYADAWVSALPSFSEAFGIVLVESLAVGTPVVARRAGGMVEIVDRPEVGRLFDGDEPEALADALLDALELAEDPGTAARCRARAEDFSVERSVDRMLALYADLVA